MGVSFSLKKQLDQFNLDVSCSFPGGVLVIQGESGSGKSTILNCISGLLTPENGKVEVNSRVVYNSSQNVNIPVIASGGAGEASHFYDGIVSGGADAVLAASLFHYKELGIMELKNYLRGRGIPVRM